MVDNGRVNLQEFGLNDTRQMSCPSGDSHGNDAFTFAEEHLAEHAKRYSERFVKWHGIDR